MKTPSYQINQN